MPSPIIEIGIGITLLLILWRRFVSTWVRVLMLAVVLSYGVIAAYWYNTLGGG